MRCSKIGHLYEAFSYLSIFIRLLSANKDFSVGLLEFLINPRYYSALWVMQSTTGLRPMDCIKKSGLIKGSEVFWLILQSRIVIRLDDTGFNPVMLCYMVKIQ